MLNNKSQNVNPRDMKNLEIRNGVTVISICEVEDQLDPESDDMFSGMDYDAFCEVLMDWCKRWGVHYYGRCREDFSIGSAVREAKSNRMRFVVVEDMS